jgi:serine/threonine protein kinase
MVSKQSAPAATRPWKPAARPDGAEGRGAIGGYELLKPIGRGATGTVYLARKEGSEREVAVKVLHGGGGPDAHDRFVREVAIAQRLVHRHMVRVVDSGEDDGAPYLVMEMLRGQSLREVLKQAQGGIDVDTAVDLVVQLCVGLHHAHEQGLVHRDIKPANVFLSEEGVVKILDFGVAKLTDTTMTADGSLVGTLAYMAPEQLTGRGEIDGRADVFSAGVLLYELLTGKRPFAADSPAAIVARITQDNAPSLPAQLPEPIASLPALEAMLRRALEKDSAQRFDTAQDFAHALLRMQLAPRAAVAPRPPVLNETLYADHVVDVSQQTLVASQPLTRPGRSTWLYSSVAAAAVVVVATIVGTVLYNKAAVAGPTTTVAPVAPAPVPVTPPPVTPKTTSPVAAPRSTTDVLIESTPPGASILRDGKPIGETPAKVSVTLDEELRLERSGFELGRVRVDEAAFTAGTVAVSLTALPRVRVRVSGTYAFEVLSGNRTISAAATTHDISVFAGQTVRLQAREYLVNQTVKVGRSNLELQAPLLGSLEVRSNNQTCPVFVSGREFPPVPLRVRVAVGDYNVEIRCPDGRSGRTRASVTANVPEVARIDSVR